MSAPHQKLSAYIEGIGLIGPGFDSWPHAQRIFRGEERYAYAAANIPAAAILSAAERRRAMPIIKLTLAAGLEAVAQAQREAALLPSVFSSSSGDAQNMHAICETLASVEREISPTRFHNSVHNSASGYWSVATGATAASTAMCAYDGSFAAGLLEALVQIHLESAPVLLFGYDIDYPQPLRQIRPIVDAFCAVFVLSAEQNANAQAHISVDLIDAPSTPMTNNAFETLRAAIPSARCLPLLECIANRRSETVMLDYLDDLQLAVTISC